ncbi:MAG: CapA family protein [Pseudochelatococcus sp.]|jgi:hypothetical protein|uniref:CapA family protein n=1 Tax=Pseudochelatococcus sp. TaxID=2020869 RepID=UPI003D8AF227
MLFIGDVAVDGSDVFTHVGFPSVFSAKPICLNFEGPVIKAGSTPAWGVFNSENWHASFSEMKPRVAFLGNNHIADMPDGVMATRRALLASGIGVFGAGADLAEASAPVDCVSGSETFRLLGAGWPVIGCGSAGLRTPGVNPFDARRLVEGVRILLTEAPSSRVVVVLHWNYEFERYPQPAHRKLAIDLVDAGAYAVIGHHPHIVGPVERYKGRTIAYSLGNWAFSYGRYFGGKLRFPPSSFHQIAVELEDGADVVHHVQFSPPLTLDYKFREAIHERNFSLKPEFEGFSRDEYVKWFREHRLKSKLLPIYTDPEYSLTNTLRDRWVDLRQILIDAAARAGIKKLRR